MSAEPATQQLVWWNYKLASQVPAAAVERMWRALDAIAEGALINHPGHVDYLSKAQIARIAHEARPNNGDKPLPRATGGDPYGAGRPAAPGSDMEPIIPLLVAALKRSHTALCNAVEANGGAPAEHEACVQAAKALAEIGEALQ